MNFYNPYLPFAWAQSLDFQSAQPMMNLNTLLTTHLTSLMLASSDSLNAKREFTYQSDDELDFMSAVNYKKVKPCSGIPIANMLGQNLPSQKRDSKSKQSKSNYQHVIAVDEDEDCSIIDNPSMKAHKDWNFEKGFDLGNHFSSLITQRRSTVEGQPSNSIFGKESEIIVIDNDEDQLTCDMTPLLKQDSLSICSDNSETQKSQTAETALKGGKKSIGDVSQFLHLANIPSFKLSALTRKRNKERKVKSVWKPSNFEPETFQRWTEQMEKAVGIQITNEEKVLKIIKSFDMNLEAALEKIKRNKAYYKDYFRVKKLNKNSTLLF